MDEPFSGHKLDSSFFPFPFPTFHQLDVNNNIFFGTADQFVAPSEKTMTPPGRKRATSGKDRHSKICTALGMRNRRMRLSLDVAPDFFDIQDMLGFDKASKTLRWLITMAEPAIKDLIAVSRGGSIESSTSGLESGDMISTNSGSKAACDHIESPKAKRVCRRRPPSRRAALIPATVARELRLKARERARERTEKKRLLLQSSLDDHLLYDGTVPFETTIAKVEEDCSGSPNQHRQLAAIFDYNQSTMCLNETVNLFHQHWDMEDVPLQSRLWEA